MPFVHPGNLTPSFIFLHLLQKLYFCKVCDNLYILYNFVDFVRFVNFVIFCNVCHASVVPSAGSHPVVVRVHSFVDGMRGLTTPYLSSPTSLIGDPGSLSLWLRGPCSGAGTCLITPAVSGLSTRHKMARLQLRIPNTFLKTLDSRLLTSGMTEGGFFSYQ